jgi:ankyrin repeat protein
MACKSFAFKFIGFSTDKRVRFLLAHLYIKSLVGKSTKTKVISALEALSKGPEALKDAYSEAIVRIDSQPQGDRTLARNVLSWISYAQRPLTTGELCHALATEPGDKELDLDNIPDIEDIESVCAGLVTIDEESQIVRLVHYTTQDYLVSIREKWNHDAQYNVASTCLTYLCLDTFTSGSCTSDVEFESRLEQYKFLDYSAGHWEHHVAAVEQEICGLAMVLLQNSNSIACATQTRTIASTKYKRERYSQDFPKNVTGLHIAVSFGLSYLSKQLLFSGQGEKLTLADARDSHDQTPLMWAARNGHQDTVMLLLSIDDVNPNARDNRGRTPLIWAAIYGHKDTVMLLLSIGNVNTNARDDMGRTPLIWAAIYGHEDTVKQLLLSTDKFDPNARDNSEMTPLLWAVAYDQENVVELLLSTDRVDPNTKDINGFTPLIYAVLKGSEPIVEMLLSTGKVDPTANDNEGVTPLMLAVVQGHEGIVKLMLSTNEVNLNREDNSIQMLLRLAAKKGHKAVVELLESYSCGS